MKLIDLDSARQQRKGDDDGQEKESAYCEFCGEPKHEQPLQCPRIAAVTKYSDGSQIDIFFKEDFYYEDVEIEGPDDDADPDGAA